MPWNAIASAVSGAKNRKFQSAEAQKQRDWTERMSNTALRRSMTDARAGGLNPILMASGGMSASAGGAAAASSSHRGLDGSSIGSNAMAMAKFGTELRTLKHNERRADSDASAASKYNDTAGHNASISFNNVQESMSRVPGVIFKNNFDRSPEGQKLLKVERYTPTASAAAKGFGDAVGGLFKARRNLAPGAGVRR